MDPSQPMGVSKSFTEQLIDMAVNIAGTRDRVFVRSYQLREDGTILDHRRCDDDDDKEEEGSEKAGREFQDGAVSPGNSSTTTMTMEDTVRDGAKDACSYVCDRCSRTIKELRFKCQVCPSFNYCIGCWMDSSRIHPGHEFEGLNGIEAPEERSYPFSPVPQFEAMRGEDFPLRFRGENIHGPEHGCRSCMEVVFCYTTWHGILLNTKLDVPRSHIVKNTHTLSRDWKVRITSLAEACALGCVFCSYILEKMFGPKTFMMWTISPMRPWYLGTTDPAEDNRRRKEVIENAMKLSSTLENDSFTITVAPILKTTESSGPWLEKIKLGVTEVSWDQKDCGSIFSMLGALQLELQVFASKRNPASINVVKTVPNPRPGSTSGLDQAREWLDDCLKTHGKTCSSLGSCSTQPFLPTRVIDVADCQSLRISESSPGDCGCYCALSYQWGGDQKFCLSTTSLPQLRKGFSINEVPASIADAVVLSRKLGIQYLWVDALCIIQDDPLDKAHQISRMENIYRYSTLTIIAARSLEANAGFMGPTEQSDDGIWPTLIPMTYPVMDPDEDEEAANNDEQDLIMEDADQSAMNERKATKVRGSTSSTSSKTSEKSEWGTIWLMDDVEDAANHTSKMAVDRRGWCLQERLLSPRVLNYGLWPTWRCSKCSNSDGGYYVGGDSIINKDDEFARLLFNLSKPMPMMKIDYFVMEKLLSSWYGVVEDFSKREFSDPMDRLPGIGGIASLISQVSGMDYVAGLWRQNMLHDLMWYTDAKEWLDRPTKWRAPTWSWASVNSPISYRHINHATTALAAVMDCSTTHGPTGPHGNLQDGRVQVRGPFARVSRDDVLRLLKAQELLPPQPKSNHEVDWFRQLLTYTCYRNDNKGQITEEEIEEKLPKKVYAMITFQHSGRIFHEEFQHGTFFSGLLFQPVDSHYERIGSFKQESLPWLDLDQFTDEATITIC